MKLLRLKSSLIMVFSIVSIMYAQNSIIDESYDDVWQVKAGMSVNNLGATNLEISTVNSFAKSFSYAFDYRVYSFLSITPSLTTKPIIIYKNISILLKTGLDFLSPGPLVLFDVTNENSVMLRYSAENQ